MRPCRWRPSDSVSRKTLYNSGGWNVQQAGGYIWVSVNIKIGGGSWDFLNCPYTLPAGLRPAANVQAPLLTANGASWTGSVIITTAGVIQVGNTGSAGSTDSRVGVIMFPIGG